MTHTAAVRASILFVFMAIVFGAVGLASSAAAAEAMFMISVSLFAVMLLFALATPAHRTVPVRSRKSGARL
jgi:hypothetical protein